MPRIPNERAFSKQSYGGGRPPNRIGMLREMAGMSFEDIGSRIRVTSESVRRWEKNETQIPDGRKLALAEMFEVSVPFLMGWPEGVPNGGDEAA